MRRDDRSDRISTGELVVIALAFAFGGFVKGVVGVALPLLVMAVLTMFVDVPTAVTLVTLPTLVANLYQGMRPDQFSAVVTRFWPVPIALVPGIVIGTGFLASLSKNTLLACVGFAILGAVALQVFRPNRPVPAHLERWTTPAAGLVSGVLGGVAGLYGPPMAVYLAGLRLSPAMFIASISLSNFFACLPLAAALYLRGIAQPHDIAVSIAAIAPMFCGILAGQAVRSRIDAKLFTRLLQVALTVAGLNFLRGAFLG